MRSRGLHGDPGPPYLWRDRDVKRPGGWFLRIAYFTGGGPFGVLPLTALARAHDIVLIVMPGGSTWRRWARQGATWLRVRRPDEVVRWARRQRVPRLTARSGSDARIVSSLRALAPDLICIATFSWKLDHAVVSLPRLGAVNLHPSLLPRHRGPNPYFWTYYHDDRHAGVTVHVAEERVDAGPILNQHPIALPRGWPVHELYLESARQGAHLLSRAVTDLGAGTSRATAQDESRATQAPRVRPGEAKVDFDRWDVERVWHFLHGLHPRFREPLRDAAGRPVHYTRVLGYEERSIEGPPGTVDPAGPGWKLWCRNGYLHLAGAGERPSALEGVE